MDLETDLNTRADIASVAYDKTASLLWVSSRQSNGEQLIAIDTQATPTIVHTIEPFQPFEGLASDGTSLWGLDETAHVLVRIDPTAGAFEQSYLIPGADDTWFDLAFADGRMFLIGENTASNKGVLEEESTRMPLPTVGGGGVAGST